MSYNRIVIIRMQGFFKLKNTQLLVDVVNRRFASRKAAARAMGVSIFVLNNMIARKMRVIRLANGSYMTLTSFNRFVP